MKKGISANEIAGIIDDLTYRFGYGMTGGIVTGKILKGILTRIDDLSKIYWGLLD